MRHFSKFAFFLVISLLSSTIISCKTGGSYSKSGQADIKYKTPKYIFFVIGDGMSAAQINLGEVAMNEPGFRKTYKRKTGRVAGIETDDEKGGIGIGKTNLRRFTTAGMANTFAENRYITGSAAAATALATGHKTTIGTISLSGDHRDTLRTIAEMAKASGMRVGIISSVSIDHATPAGFYAHTKDRNNYRDIDEQLLGTGFDYFAGGSLKHNSWGKNVKQTFDEYIQEAAKVGYTYICKKDDLENLNNQSGKIIATVPIAATQPTYDGAALPYNIDLNTYKEDNTITLADFTRKGIDVLDNPKGFFMMVESGKIDWMCHANDAVSVAYEMTALDETLGVIMDFYEKHPTETLIVMTGDHDCGGLTLGFAGTHYGSSFKKLKNQHLSSLAFEKFVAQWRKDGAVTFDVAMKVITECFGLGDASLGLQLSEYETNRLKTAFDYTMRKGGNLTDEEKELYYGGYDPLTVTATHILANKAGLEWASYSHTAVPVPVLAMGQGSLEFNGYYDNTDIPKKIIKIAKLSDK